MLITLMAVVAFASLFTLVGMAIQSKTTGAVAVIVFSIVLLLVSASVQSRLLEPEFNNDLVLTDAGDMVAIDPVPIPNPAYLKGTARSVYQFIGDLLPSGQALQLANIGGGSPYQLSGLGTGNPGLLPLYSLLVTLASTFAGMYLFWRKDLK